MFFSNASSNTTGLFGQNAKRWLTLPGGKRRRSIGFLLKYPDWLLKWQYERFAAFWKKERQWEHERYAELFSGRHVLEVGGGMGYDGLQYAKRAASYTWAELSETQIEFLKRIAGLYGNGNFSYEWLQDPLTHAYHRRFNAFYAHGVLHHVPLELAQAQFAQIDRYLEPGSKVVMLMYPKQRWIDCGKPSFETFGKYTDGGCPWAEWYDEEKILQLCGEGYKLLNTIYWGHNQTEFVNFELEKNYGVSFSKSVMS